MKSVKRVGSPTYLKAALCILQCVYKQLSICSMLNVTHYWISMNTKYTYLHICKYFQL